jgi:poly(A) polymerase
MNSGGKIFPTGSYRLGVYGPSSDIDCLVVAPRHIKRFEHFFNVLAPILRENPDVTELNEVQDTAVPVIKMKF